MDEDVKTELLTIDAGKIPKHFFEAEWEIPRNLDVKTIHLGDYSVPSFSRRNETITNPVANWNVPTRYGFELFCLESALKWFISELQAVGYYNISKPKLRIKFELNLGEIWIILIDEMSGQELASYVRTAEAVTTRLSNMSLSGLADYGELYDLPVLVHGETRVNGSYVTVKREVKDFSNPRAVKVSTVEEVIMRPSLSSSLTYYQLFTGEKPEIESLLAHFISGQTRERICELSDAELDFLLHSRGKKMLPATINGLRYIGEGQPRLFLDGYSVIFDGDIATKEANLADIVFGKPRDFTKMITYEEIFETLEGKNAKNDEFARIAGRKWLELDKKERENYIRDYKQRMRQLNYRLGAMFGLGENKALVSVDAGIAIDHRLL